VYYLTATKGNYTDISFFAWHILVEADQVTMHLNCTIFTELKLHFVRTIKNLIYKQYGYQPGTVQDIIF